MKTKLSIARERHAKYYFGMAGVCSEKYDQGNLYYRESILTFEKLLPQIRQGFAQCMDAPELQKFVLDMLLSGESILRDRLPETELLQWAETGLRIAESQQHHRISWFMNFLGNCYRKMEKLDDALHWNETALAQAKETNDHTEIGNSLCYLGVAYLKKRAYKMAIDYLEASLEIAKSDFDTKWEIHRSGMLSRAYLSMGEIEKSIQFAEMASNLAVDSGNLRAFASYNLSLSKAYRAKRLVNQSIERALITLRIDRTFENFHSISACLHHLGLCYIDIDNFDEAKNCFEEGLAIGNMMGKAELIASCHQGFSRMYQKKGDDANAILHTQYLLEIAVKPELGVLRSTIFGDHAGLLIKLGRIQEAIEYYEKCLTISIAEADRTYEAISHANIGICMARIGYKEAALDKFKTALELANLLDDIALAQKVRNFAAKFDLKI